MRSAAKKSAKSTNEERIAHEDKVLLHDATISLREVVCKMVFHVVGTVQWNYDKSTNFKSTLISHENTLIFKLKRKYLVHLCCGKSKEELL